MEGLNSLNYFNENKYVPSTIEFIHYLFWDKGISLIEFNKLPIPYIISVLKSFTYVKEEEAKAYKK